VLIEVLLYGMSCCTPALPSAASAIAPAIAPVVAPAIAPAAKPIIVSSAPAAEPVIVSAKWLAAHLDDRATVVLLVAHDDADFRRGHIPGARVLSYYDITTERNGLSSELPDANALRRVFASAGVSDDSRVVLYGDDPLMNSRAFFTLEYLGQRHAAILDGGVNAWTAAGGRMSTDAPVIREGRITTRERPELVADADWIMAHRESPHVAFIDTRSDEEYLGTGERHGMPSKGHIPGARQLQWQQLFADPPAGAFKSEPELAAAYANRVRPGDTVVTYCYIGYRASMTYLVARALGYQAKLYDGSYQDWAKRDLPVTAGSRP
jgi:thiosulfate/3-mercaptopyruvate sulfurtransferase